MAARTTEDEVRDFKLTEDIERITLTAIKNDSDLKRAALLFTLSELEPDNWLKIAKKELGLKKKEAIRLHGMVCDA